MRAYQLTTGVLFALLALAHLWRIAFEERALARDPFFVGITLLCVVLSAWALRLARRSAPA